MSVEPGQTLAVFVLDNDASARRMLKRVAEIDKTDANVEIIDSAIADRGRLGRVKVHQTTDEAGMKGARRGAALGVVVGAMVLGPVGAVVGGAAGGVLNGLRNRFHDIGIDDKFMRQVGKEVDKGKSALFVQYSGNWSASIGMVEEAVRAEHALLIHSTLPPETAAKLQALVQPAVEQLGGDETVSDYEVDVPETPAPAPVEEATPPAVAAAPAAAVAAAPAPARADDLTQLMGIGPKASKALTAAGIATYEALSNASEKQIRDALYASNMTPPGNVGTWPRQASFAAKGDWVSVMHLNQKTAEDQAKARATKAKAVPEATAPDTAPPDDLTKLNGIGPRIEMILNDGGVTTYAKLEHTSTDDLREIVAAGGALPSSLLNTWPTQATYAAKGDWSGLATYNSRH